ncbi:hypothetical protein [Siphonobacter sp. BAB-5385]|uniref:hypothetical protein n=1 Tax=Siphonobacter sp. BAB-5385 TaxID=1864822 RepID=UPI00113FD768|nr:hypothetical protein [Siphonobacter sp. BAB-5385]
MRRSAQELQTYLEKPRNRTAILLAGSDDERTVFHARPASNIEEAGSYAPKFKSLVEGILTQKRKRAAFFKLLQFPLPTRRQISRASDDLNRVFEAQDRFIGWEFTTPETDEDFREYVRSKKIETFVREDVFNAIFERCNSLVVVDLPETQMFGEYPEPYAYLLPIANVFDLGLNADKSIEYCIFSIAKDRFAAFDEGYFRIFSKEKNGEGKETYTLLREVEHSLGYCPVSFIWHDQFGDAGIRRLSPLYDALADMDRLVMADVFKEDVDLHAAYPYLWYLKEKCTYRDNDGACMGGTIAWIDDNNQPKSKKCPNDCQNSFAGPGTAFKINQPGAGEHPLPTPAGFVTLPRDTLDYITEKVDSLKKELFHFLTGYDQEPDKTKALNEDQVQSQFEARINKLIYWAEHLERTHRWILETIGRLRYGVEFVKVTVNYGREFYLETLQDALTAYQDARSKGLPMFLLEVLRRRVVHLLARNNDHELQRLTFLELLEPYPDVPLQSVPQGTVDYELKANFPRYVGQFERDNGDLVSFGSNGNIAKKLETIETELYNYVEARRKLWEQRQRETPQTA